MVVTREAIIAAARGWLGTPYHHQASVRGAGCDCLGLIRGVWRTLYGPEPEAMPPYTRDWGNATGSETLIEAACRHLRKLEDLSAAAPADVIVFRMRDGGVAKHAGILVCGDFDRDAHGSRPGRPSRLPRIRSGVAPQDDGRPSKDGRALHHDEEGPRMIHAQEGLGVVETTLGRWWLRRAVAAFRFPDIPVLQFHLSPRGEVGAQRAPGEGASSD